MLKAVAWKKARGILEEWFGSIFKLTIVNFDEFRSEWLHEKLAVAAWTMGNV